MKTAARLGRRKSMSSSSVRSPARAHVAARLIAVVLLPSPAFALVTSKTISGTNVAKGSDGLAVTVNSSFFQLCPESPGPAGLQNSAALQQCVGVNGSSTVHGALNGTGYDGAGAGGGADAAAAADTVQSIEGNTYIYGGGTGWPFCWFCSIC